MSLKKQLSLILLVGLLSQFSFGQKYSVHKKNKAYIALTGGFNFSFPKVTDRYTVLTSFAGTEDDSFKKKYDKFGKNKGAQFGFRYSYNFSNAMSIVTGFGYESLGFNYVTHFSWLDTIGNQDFNREMHHLQKISYFSVPIMAKWEMTTGQLIPYMQAGIFLDFRHQGKKVIHYDNTIDEKETENQISKSDVVSITDYTRKFNMGFMGGIGIAYHTKFAAFGVESNFRSGFRRIMKDENRYSDYNGFALQYLDVFDQVKLSALSIEFTVSVPINHSVSMNILRRRKY